MKWITMVWSSIVQISLYQIWALLSPKGLLSLCVRVKFSKMEHSTLLENYLVIFFGLYLFMWIHQMICTIALVYRLIVLAYNGLIWYGMKRDEVLWFGEDKMVWNEKKINSRFWLTSKKNTWYQSIKRRALTNARDIKLQNLWNNVKKSSKIGAGMENFDMFLRNFWSLMSKFYFCKGDWRLSLSTHFLRLSLESFGKSIHNPYTMLFVLDIIYHLTCGESNL